jgi:hypothetical protein
MNFIPLFLRFGWFILAGFFRWPLSRKVKARNTQPFEKSLLAGTLFDIAGLPREARQPRQPRLGPWLDFENWKVAACWQSVRHYDCLACQKSTVAALYWKGYQNISSVARHPVVQLLVTPHGKVSFSSIKVKRCFFIHAPTSSLTYFPAYVPRQANLRSEVKRYFFRRIKLVTHTTQLYQRKPKVTYLN